MPRMVLASSYSWILLFAAMACGGEGGVVHRPMQPRFGSDRVPNGCPAPPAESGSDSRVMASGDASQGTIEPASYRLRVDEERGRDAEVRRADVPIENRPQAGEEVTSRMGDETSAETEDSADEIRTILGPPWHSLGPISVEYLYTSEVFNNTHGGLQTRGATRYRGNFDLTMRLDTQKANWWSGGEVFVYMQQSHGRTLTQDFVGDGQWYSNIDTAPRPQDLTQLGEYWYRHHFADDSLLVTIGRQDANAEFAYADLGGDFVNASFTGLPNVPMPFWPFQTLGVSALYQANDSVRMGGGVYDHGGDEKQWWVVTTNQGMFYIGQVDWQPFADCDESLMTLVRFGSWYTNSDTEAVDGNQVFEGNYGFYSTIDRALIPEADDPDQGLAAFCQFSWATPDRNQVDQHFAAGIVYRGLLPDRDEDTTGLGITQIFFCQDQTELTGQTDETAVELFYKARFSGRWAVEPDLQYIARPQW